MYFLKAALCVCSIVLPFAISTPIQESTQAALRTIYQFSNGTWIENLAVRSSNGQILATDLSHPNVYLLDPSIQPTPDPVTISAFFPSNGLLGITEVHPDIFITISLTLDIATLAVTPNSSIAWEIDLRSFSPSLGPSSAKVRKIANLPSLLTANGITPLCAEESTVLIADSAAGLVYKLNTQTGTLSLAIDDPLFKPGPNSGFRFGVNGITVINDDNKSTKGKGKSKSKTLYFSNSDLALLGSLPLSSSGAAISPATVFGTATQPDDFAVFSSPSASTSSSSNETTIFIAQNSGDSLAKLQQRGGSAQVIVGAGSGSGSSSGSNELNGPTSVRFAAQRRRRRGQRRRGEDDDDDGDGEKTGNGNGKQTLYVSTSGRSHDPATGQTVAVGGGGGKIVEVQVS